MAPQSPAAESDAAEFQSAFDRIVLESLGPLAQGMAALFAAFGTVYLLAGPRHGGAAVAMLDISVAVIFALMAVVFHRGLVPAGLAQPVAVACAGVVLADILTTLALTAEPLQTVYVGLLIISVSCFLLSAWWTTVSVAGCVVGWSLVARAVAPADVFLECALALVAASGLAAIIQVSRLRTHRRLELLRRSDAEHKLQLEKTLQVTEGRYRQIVETANEGIGVIDRGGLIVFANSRLSTMLGYAAGEVVGREFLGLVADEDRLVVEDGLRALGLGQSQQLECRLVHTDSSHRRCLMSGTLVAETHESGSGLLVMLTDITEWRQTEEQLLRSQKLEALGELAGGIAHDFNNLLMAIEGSATILELRHVSDSEGAEPLAMIHRAVRRGSDLTRRLLAAGRRQPLETTDLDLNELIEREVEMLRRLIPESISIEVKTHPRLPAVRADRAQLLQVLMNLCVNSRDAMPEGGVITIETGLPEAPTAILARHPEVKSGSLVALTVRDTGVGMDEATAAHVFEPFFTTKEPGKGTGLGLATVYGIVTQHGGIVELDSRPGAGTSFRIYLPATEGQAELRASSGAFAVVTGRESVLVVEDDADVRAGVVEGLRRLGYRVLSAANGSEALATLQGERVDLVLTDVVMPKMGGRELFERCRQLSPGTAFIFSSGYPRESLVGVLRDDDSTAFISKPYSLDKLAVKVRQALATRGKG